MQGSVDVGRAVARYLPTLEGDVRPSTLRAYRWALTDLATTWGREPLEEVLAGERLTLWLAAPMAGGREPSPASVRQRATATRALVRWAVAERVLDAATAATALELLRRPATPPADRQTAPARVLLARAAGGRPHGVSWHVWVRFRAHVMLLAETGAPERVLGRALLADLVPDRTHVVLAGERYALRDTTRHALGTWLEAREELVATLQGSPPPQLWVRAHPSVHPRTGAVAAVGMPITARGLRKAFGDVVLALVGHDPRLHGCSVAHVRALAPRREGAPERPDGGLGGYVRDRVTPTGSDDTRDVRVAESQVGR